MSITEIDDLRQKLTELRIQHRKLDNDIMAAQTELPYLDNLDLRRMKKRKLTLKEMIVKLESQIIPDLNA